MLYVMLWMIATLITFRYVGYSFNQSRLKGHNYQRICRSCKCTTCGRDAYDHYRDTPCGDGKWEGMHTSDFFLGFGVSLLWPLVLAWYGVSTGYRASGIEAVYFKPPPQVLTREERRAKKDAAKDERIKALEKRNQELEKECEIKSG